MILNEKKEQLPVDFLTSFIGRGWDEISSLKASVDGVKKDFVGANETADILQDLLDAYLICVGRLEKQLNAKKYLQLPKEESLKEGFFDSAEPVVVVTEPVEAVPEVEEEPKNDEVVKAATEVMAAYQNANKWLDSVKEIIYTKINCPFFSSFVHELAHTMPGRFDKFGDILHTVNMEIPYPETVEIPKKPANINEAFEVIFTVLDAIKEKLNAFIKCTDESFHGMACAAEALLNDIEGEYPMLYRLQAKAKECGEDTVSFDKFVGQYVEHKDSLLESKEPEAESKPIKEAFEYFVDFDDVELDTTQPSLHEAWINH